MKDSYEAAGWIAFVIGATILGVCGLLVLAIETLIGWLQ